MQIFPQIIFCLTFLIITILCCSCAEKILEKPIPCKIPNEEMDAICSRIDQCPAFQALQNNSKQLDVNLLSFMKSIQCNTDDLMICCPLKQEFYKNPLILCDQSNITKQILRENAPRPKISTRISSDEERVDGELPSRKECGAQIVKKVAGGQITDINEFPWVALMVYNSSAKGSYGCGGALISKRFVLTAAHCVTGDDYEDKGGLKYVRLGEYNTQTEEDCIDNQDTNTRICAEPAINVLHDKIIIHPGYDIDSHDKHHDIALIRLSEEVKFSLFIKPICLPLNGISPGIELGNNLTVSGWGKTDLFKDHFGLILSPVKLKLKLSVVESQICTKAFSKYDLKLDVGQVCAGGALSKDSCRGDSGCPLMHFDRRKKRWVASGIVSFGLEPCGQEGVPGVYTNVEKYVDWIRNSIKDNKD